MAWKRIGHKICKKLIDALRGDIQYPGKLIIYRNSVL